MIRRLWCLLAGRHYRPVMLRLSSGMGGYVYKLNREGVCAICGDRRRA